MEQITFGDSFFSRLESFKEIIESPTIFEEENARLILQELEDIIKEKKYNPKDETNKSMKLSDRLAIREFFELVIILNSRTRNYEEIRNYYKQLKLFYFNSNDLPISHRMYMLMGLSLLTNLLPKQHTNADDNSGNEDDKDYITVDFKFDDFHIDLYEIQLKYKNFDNLYLTFISKIDEYIKMNFVHSFFYIRQTSPSVLFDEILNKLSDGFRREITKDVLSTGRNNIITDIQKMLKLNKIEETRQLLQSLNCRISKDGIVAPPDYIKRNFVAPKSYLLNNQILKHNSKYDDDSFFKKPEVPKPVYRSLDICLRFKRINSFNAPH